MMIPRTHVTACWRCVATCCTPSGAIPGVQGDGRISIEALAGELMAWKAGALTQAPGDTEKTMALLLKHQLPRRSSVHQRRYARPSVDRQGDGKGKSVSVRRDLGGPRLNQK